MKNYILVIPARLSSTRLPRKPLINILGKSMILRTYEQCIKAVDKSLVFVATDSDEIRKHCEKENIEVIMTSTNALTGTDRVFEVSQKIKARYYINVQGDEPVINPYDINKILSSIDFNTTRVFNGFTPIIMEEDYYSRSVPKVVFDHNKELLYMSRSPIPGNKNNEFQKSWRQVCIYAFPYDALNAFHKDGKSLLEGHEDIEILRFLELGYKVNMVEMSNQSIPVDNEEDLEKVKIYLRKT